MAVRSRTSLRVSVRQDHDEEDSLIHDDNHHPRSIIINPTGGPPLSKPPRIHPSSTTSRPRRRRKSSPDLLDATTPDIPRRTSTRLVSASSSSSSNTDHHNPPHLKARLLPRHATPTTAATTTTTTTKSTPPISSFFLRGLSRESPDPLDTISPATATTDSKRFPGRTPSSVSGRPSHQPGSLRSDELSSPPRKVGKANRPSTDGDVAALGNSPQPPPPPGPNPTSQDPAPTTSKPAVKEQRRSLRSHDGGSRARSELALYFPNYEQLLSVEPPKPEFLAGNTTIRLIDDLTSPPLPASALTSTDADSPFGNPLLNLHNCETITLSEPPPPPPPSDKDTPRTTPRKKPPKAKEDNEDALNEGAYFRPHRRNERQEKQLRNIERDRAQHEKQQLDRLLDELQSTDWPRVMGIGTLTDPDERKHYETKRAFFINEISALIQKFKIWKEEEKRRKVEKEKLVLQQQQEQSQSAGSTITTSHQPPASHKRRRPQPRPSTNEPDEQEVDDTDARVSTTSSSPDLSLPDVLSPTETPDINDVDAAAARQLLQEARSATAGKKLKQTTISFSGHGPKKKPKTHASPPNQDPPQPPSSPPILPPPPPPPDDKPFTSFYAKPYLRETAMSTHRKGRVRFAFGHPIPEMEEREFVLPSEILTTDAIHACRRKRRRLTRECRNSIG
ncbi:hypothetical protein FE257_007838 [Aspergillus nanangensis]|uniref:Something about silencing protein 4 domain-containing protein n=1 Tax=Aspergillus nanangensis TaxID=2582783 RepID=A0AAD4CX44_ASPNN|nr:hypothetical protein FE257_007838 [Aspergillus nanangensis]